MTLNEDFTSIATEDSFYQALLASNFTEYVQFIYGGYFNPVIIIIIVVIIIIIIIILQPFVGPWPLFKFLDPIHSQ
jgi:hypothetical protein